MGVTQKIKLNILMLICVLTLSSCAEVNLASHVVKSALPAKQEGMYKVGNPYKIGNKTYYPKVDYKYKETGIASWYGPGFHKKQTANGEIYNQYDITAAHRTLPLPSIVKVTNLENGRSLKIRVNDRGPYAHNRIIDLSKRSAELLGVIGKGTAKVRVEVVEKESRQIANAARKGEIVQQHQYAQVSESIKYAAENRVQAQQHNPKAGGIFVHAGSFKELDNAHKIIHKYKDYGTSQIATVQVNDSHFHRVLIGPFDTVDKASDVLQSIAATGGDGKVIQFD